MWTSEEFRRRHIRRTPARGEVTHVVLQRLTKGDDAEQFSCAGTGSAGVYGVPRCEDDPAFSIDVVLLIAPSR